MLPLEYVDQVVIYFSISAEFQWVLSFSLGGRLVCALEIRTLLRRRLRDI